MDSGTAISFCTTCANRLHQFERVFSANLQQLASFPDVEWVILDYGSTDGLREYLLPRLPSLPPRLVFATGYEGKRWHASVAKNVAHRLGRGRILVNLDADNVIGDAIPVIRSYFSQGARVLHLWSGAMPDGSYGRIAITQSLFHQLGGYDEAFFPMGYQDTDLLHRAAAAGAPVFHHRGPSGLAVPNSKQDSIVNCRIGNASWRDYNDANRHRSQWNIERGVLRANQSPPWAPLHACVSYGGLQPTGEFRGA